MLFRTRLCQTSIRHAAKLTKQQTVRYLEGGVNAQFDGFQTPSVLLNDQDRGLCMQLFSELEDDLQLAVHK